MSEPLCILSDSCVFLILTWQLFVESDLRETSQKLYVPLLNNDRRVNKGQLIQDRLTYA